MMPRLENLRHEKFAQMIAFDECSPRTAYVRVGFADTPWSGPNARKLKNSAAVKARVAELVEQDAKESQIKRDWIRHDLLAMMEGRKPTRIIVNAKGEETKEYDHHAAAAALDRSLGGNGVLVATQINNEINGDEVSMDPRSLARTILGIVREANAEPDGDEPLELSPLATDDIAAADSSDAPAAMAVIEPESLDEVRADVTAIEGRIAKLKDKRAWWTRHLAQGG
jgi:hypothetical protein